MKRQRALNIIGSILAVSFVLLSKPLTKKATDGFTIHSITSAFPSDPRWEASSPASPEVIDKALSQKFRYLARGAQCFAFVSEDGQYVLKFFNQPNYKRKGVEHRNIDFASYKIACEQLPEETGLLSVHLVPGTGSKRVVTLIDKLNIAHKVDLESMEFLLQKRADLTIPAISSAMKEHKEEVAKGYLDAIFALTHKRVDQGILDRDPNMTKNLGVLDGKAFLVDIGRLSYGTSAQQFKTDLMRFEEKNRGFRQWLQENYPSLYTYYLEQYALLEQHYQKKTEV